MPCASFKGNIHQDRPKTALIKIVLLKNNTIYSMATTELNFNIIIFEAWGMGKRESMRTF